MGKAYDYARELVRDGKTDINQLSDDDISYLAGLLMQDDKRLAGDAIIESANFDDVVSGLSNFLIKSATAMATDVKDAKDSLFKDLIKGAKDFIRSEIEGLLENVVFDNDHLLERRAA